MNDKQSPNIFCTADDIFIYIFSQIPFKITFLKINYGSWQKTATSRHILAREKSPGGLKRNCEDLLFLKSLTSYILYLLDRMRNKTKNIMLKDNVSPFLPYLMRFVKY